jgi:hypothetical protein
MTVLIPPAVLEEVQAVLDLPMAADVIQELGCGDPVGIETGDEVPYVMTNKLPIPGCDHTVHA